MIPILTMKTEGDGGTEELTFNIQVLYETRNTSVPLPRVIDNIETWKMIN